MDQAPIPAWQRGEVYEGYVGRWSRRVAPRFVDWLGVPPGRRWLDVGCGTGALCGAILERAAPASVIGVEPSAGFLSVALERLAGKADLRSGTATDLPLADAAVDVVVSGLVLNFVDDQPAALREMARVCAGGGTIAAYVWDYAEGMQMMRRFWDAAVEHDPRGSAIDESARYPLCHPDALVGRFEGAGLDEVATTGIVIDTPFEDFDDYWQPFLGGQGPAPAYLMSLDRPSRDRLRDAVHARLPVAEDGAIALTARAWAVRGRKGEA
jgi:SAM-dependent methyltransferase